MNGRESHRRQFSEVSRLRCGLDQPSQCDEVCDLLRRFYNSKSTLASRLMRALYSREVSIDPEMACGNITFMYFCAYKILVTAWFSFVRISSWPGMRPTPFAASQFMEASSKTSNRRWENWSARGWLRTRRAFVTYVEMIRKVKSG